MQPNPDFNPYVRDLKRIKLAYGALTKKAVKMMNHPEFDDDLTLTLHNAFQQFKHIIMSLEITEKQILERLTQEKGEKAIAEMAALKSTGPDESTPPVADSEDQPKPKEAGGKPPRK